MTLELPQRGRGRPKKISTDINPNKIIDIWLKEEPRPVQEDALAPVRAGAELVLVLELIVAVGIGMLYVGVRL